MKRVALAVAVGCLTLFVGVVVYQAGFARSRTGGTITARQATLRYQLNQPRHWRNLFLQP